MGGLLAGLDALLVATGLLFALFLVSAVLRPLLVAVLSQAPFIGGWLASNVDAGLARFQSAIRAPADASIGILADALEWIAYQLTALTNGLLGFGGELVNGLQRLRDVTIPHALGLAEARLEGLVSDARNAAAAGLQGLAATLAGDIQAARGEAVQLVDAARAEALAASGAVLSTAEGEVRQAERAAAGLVTAAELTAKQDLGLVEQTLASLIAQARADALAAAGAVEHDVQALSRAAGVLVADSAAVLGGDIAAAEARANAVAAQLAAQPAEAISNLLHSKEWIGLVQLYEGGEAALATAVEGLVSQGLAAIRSEIGNVASIRARYAPEIAAATARLRAGK